MSILRSEELRRIEEVLVRGLESLRGTPFGVEMPPMAIHNLRESTCPREWRTRKKNSVGSRLEALQA